MSPKPFCKIRPAFCAQVTRNGNDLWLSYWVSNLDPHQHHHHHPHHKSPSNLTLAAQLTSASPEQSAAHGQTSSNQLCLHHHGLCLTSATAQDSYSSLGSLNECQSNLAGQGFNASVFHHAASVASAVASRFRQAVPASRQLLDIAAQSRPALDPDTKFYLAVLLCIAAANSVFTFVRAFSFAYGGLVAARQLHEQLLTAVVNAPARFFQITLPGEPKEVFPMQAICCTVVLTTLMSHHTLHVNLVMTQGVVESLQRAHVLCIIHVWLL